MKRRKLSDQETDQLKMARLENKQLKKEISQLRKQLQRIDVDRWQNVKDLLDSQDRKEQEQALKKQEAEDLKQWECFDCRTGTLRITMIERRDGAWYFRKCDRCEKRTSLKKYTPDVKGPKK